MSPEVSYNLIEILKIFLIGCKIKGFLVKLQTFLKKSAFIFGFLHEFRIIRSGFKRIS